MEKISNFFLKIKNNPDYRTLVENFASLSLLQIANYVFPIITFPYLVRILGVERFGLLSFAQAFIAYFTLITNYGFYLTGIQQVSVKRDDKVEAGRVFSQIMGAKVFLMAQCFVILTILVYFVPRFRSQWLLYYIVFGSVVVEAFTPYWFFRGIEKMKFITILTLISKILYTVSIFVFVKSASDFLRVPFLSIISTLLVAVFGVWLIYKNLGYKFVIPGFKEIFFQLKDGLSIFLSQVAINLYTTSNTVILGFLTSDLYVGYYTAGQKLVMIVLGFIGLVQQTVYPYANRLVAQSRENAMRFFRKLTVGMFVVGLSLSLFLFISAPVLVRVILGDKYIASISVVRILSFFPLIVGLSTVFGILIMLPYGYKKEFMTILWGASVINIVLAFILVPFLKHRGTALSALITEIYVTWAMFLFLQRKDIKIFCIRGLSKSKYDFSGRF
ncbi:MAG: flippase [candidate division WOR-3 bacterium]